MAVKAKPDGYHVVTPYLVVDGAARSIDFLKEVFDAQEVERLAAPGDRIGHAEIRIGDSLIMLGDAHGEHKPLRMMLYVYVDDADAVYQRALTAGATSVQAPVDQFYGDRSGGVKDAFSGGSRRTSRTCRPRNQSGAHRRRCRGPTGTDARSIIGMTGTMGIAPLNPSYGLRERLVGWVERSETHQPAVMLAMPRLSAG